MDTAITAAFSLLPHSPLAALTAIAQRHGAGTGGRVLWRAASDQRTVTNADRFYHVGWNMAGRREGYRIFVACRQNVPRRILATCDIALWARMATVSCGNDMADNGTLTL